MDSRETSRKELEDRLSEEVAEATGAMDDLRYVVMRLIRFVLSVTADTVWTVSLVAMMWVPLAVWTEHSRGHGYYYWPGWDAGWEPFKVWIYTMHPIVSCMIPCVLFVVAWMLAPAIGFPYRYRATKPGLGIRECEACKAKIADLWFCDRCHHFRIVKILTSFLWLVSLAVTIAFIAYDAIRLFLSIGLASNRK